MLDQTTRLLVVFVSISFFGSSRDGSNIRAGKVGLDLGGDTGGLVAASAGGARLAFLLGRVDGVKPEHVGVVLRIYCQYWLLGEGRKRTYVVPDGHNQDHGNGESGVELIEAADLGEAVAVVKGLELGCAELGGDGAGVAGDAIDLGGGDLDLLAVLDKELGELVLLEARDDAVGSCRLVMTGRRRLWH